MTNPVNHIANWLIIHSRELVEPMRVKGSLPMFPLQEGQRETGEMSPCTEKLIGLRRNRCVCCQSRTRKCGQKFQEADFSKA